MGRFSQPTLAFYLSSKREKVLTKTLYKAFGSCGSCDGHETKEHGTDVGAMMSTAMSDAMEDKRRFLKSLTSSKATKRMKKILTRGYVDLPLVGPAIGINGREFMPPPTHTLQSEPIKKWLEGYWISHGFSCSWNQDVSNPDSVVMDWPHREIPHTVQGPPTPIWILRIFW